MANHFSALKRMRQNERRKETNKARLTRFRHTMRGLRRAIAEGDREKAAALLPEVVSVIDKSLKKGVIRENKAARFKSRLMTRLNKMEARTA